MPRRALISVNRLGGEYVYSIDRIMPNNSYVHADVQWLMAVRGFWTREAGHYERREVYEIPSGMRVKKTSKEDAKRIAMEGKRITEAILSEYRPELERKYLIGCIHTALALLYKGDVREAIRNLREVLVECGEKLP